MEFDNTALINRACEIVEKESEALQTLCAQFDQNFCSIIQAILDCKGHILVTGAGTSRAVAERFAHLLSCCGTPALFIHSADSLHGASGAIKPEDIVYIISKGGESDEINCFAEIAKKQGARIIAQTENPNSPLGKLADFVYKIVSTPNIDPYGMIATGSSLVNSAACDVLCVLLLEKRGYSKREFGLTHPGGAVGKKFNNYNTKEMEK